MGLQNLIRNIGGSVGLSLASTFQERLAQVHQSMMVGLMSPLKTQYQQKSIVIQHIFEQGFSPPDALARTHGLLYRTLLQQSSYWAFMNLFFLIACVCALCILGVLLYEKPRSIHVVSAAE
jgi:DHA2 family multidrug resistance protein